MAVKNTAQICTALIMRLYGFLTEVIIILYKYTLQLLLCSEQVAGCSKISVLSWLSSLLLFLLSDIDMSLTGFWVNAEK